MPDKNKLKVFREENYHIVKTCGTCEHSLFSGASPWGTCSYLTYTHEKHTEEKNMPAHLSFVCDNYERSDIDLLQLGEYLKLLT